MFNIEISSTDYPRLLDPFPYKRSNLFEAIKTISFQCHHNQTQEPEHRTDLPKIWSLLPVSAWHFFLAFTVASSIRAGKHHITNYSEKWNMQWIIHFAFVMFLPGVMISFINPPPPIAHTNLAMFFRLFFYLSRFFFK